jgi:hypothetical protein
MSPTCPVHFDYDKDWHLVVPHLSDPYLQRFLDAQLGDYVREHMAFMTYIPGTPPWTWTLADHHYDKAAERAKQSGQMDGLYREFGFICPHAFHEALEVDEDLEQRCRDRIDEIEAPFNGLITNDKFCLSRTGHLGLTWSRRPLRLRDQAPSGSSTVPDPEGDRGGGHEVPLAGSPPDVAGLGRGSAVGSGVHAHPGLGGVGQTVGAGGARRHLQTSPGGEP